MGFNVSKSSRYDGLDLIRAIALMGILIMNSLVFALPISAYYNHQSIGAVTTLDWVLVWISEVFISHKMMGLFSALFGVGIGLLVNAQRQKKYRFPRLRVAWRMGLLFVIGVLHTVYLSEADILTTYALCGLVVLCFCDRSDAQLLCWGLVLFLGHHLFGVWVQGVLDDQGQVHSMTAVEKDFFQDGIGLAGYWFAYTDVIGDGIGLWWLVDVFCRALGMMLLGLASFKVGFIQGNWTPSNYRLVAWISGPVGLLCSGLSVWILWTHAYHPSIALIAFIPNKIGVIPMCLWYVALIYLFIHFDHPIVIRLIRMGRMALTNYLFQSVCALFAFHWLIPRDDWTRTSILAVVFAIWGVQLLISNVWMRYFTHGPVEWIWRLMAFDQPRR